MPLIVNVPGNIEAKQKVAPPPIISTDELRAERPQFTCTMINKRNERQKVWIYNRLAAILEPGQRFPVEMFDPRAELARFEQVVFEKNGTVSVKINRDWQNPYREHRCIELINSTDHPQSIRVHVPKDATVFGVVNGFMSVGPGLRLLVPVDIVDPLVKYSSLEWTVVKKKLPIPGYPNYLQEREALEEVKEERSARELAKIEAERKDRLLTSI